MICCVGLVVDVGHAMLVQRQLQAGVDAAALAGVQHLPDKPMAESVAVQYSASPGSKNAVNTVGNATTVATALCITGVPGCSRRDGGVNGIKVESSSRVPTWFGRIIGIDHLSVSAKATACSPCTVKPLDIMIVLDRTGSMCTPAGPGGSCPDLNNAVSGIQAFLKLMDPTLDKVGLTVTPPVLNRSMRNNCTYRGWDGNSNPNPWPPSSLNGKYYGYDQWWDVNGNHKPGFPSTESSTYVIASPEGADGTLSDDYIIEDPVHHTWDINPASNLVQRLGCVRTNGSTSYSLSMEEAKQELILRGRGTVQDVIIFLSDGAANTSPLQVGSHWTLGGWQNKPCGAGVEAANRMKGPQSNPATIIYTVGYDLDGSSGVDEECRRPNSNGHQDTSSPAAETGCGTLPTGWGNPTCNARAALTAMASKDAAGQPLFYYQPDPVALDAIFRQIALDLSGSRGRLIDNNSPSLSS
jgi:hypothetical protein